MTNQILKNWEWEEISAYLDGQLSEKKRQQFEARLELRVDLRLAMEEIQRTRTLIRQLPRMRAPRNFTLTPSMLGERSPIQPAHELASRMVTILRTSAVTASLLFATVVGTNFFLARPASQSIRSAEQAVPQVLATEVVEEAPPALIAPAEGAVEVMEAPYPDFAPENEIPSYSQPFPPYGGGEAGGMGGGSPGETGGPPFEGLPPMVLEEAFNATEPSMMMKEAPLAQDYASGEYPVPLTSTPLMVTPSPYPQPVSQVIEPQTSAQATLDLVAGLLAILAIVTGVAAILINRSIRAK